MQSNKRCAEEADLSDEDLTEGGVVEDLCDGVEHLLERVETVLEKVCALSNTISQIMQLLNLSTTMSKTGPL